MAFLVKTDLKTGADPAIIDKLINSDLTILEGSEGIIAQSIALMKGYLSKYYDIEAIFSTTGANRHLTVLKHLKSIVTFEVFLRTNRDPGKALQMKNDEAMKWLENLNTGEFFDKTLPREVIAPDAVDTSKMGFGSNKKYDSRY